MLDLELKTTQSFEMEKTLSNYYTKATFNSSGGTNSFLYFAFIYLIFLVFKNYFDISSVGDVRNWISNVIKGTFFFPYEY